MLLRNWIALLLSIKLVTAPIHLSFCTCQRLPGWRPGIALVRSVYVMLAASVTEEISVHPKISVKLVHLPEDGTQPSTVVPMHSILSHLGSGGYPLGHCMEREGLSISSLGSILTLEADVDRSR